MLSDCWLPIPSPVQLCLAAAVLRLVLWLIKYGMPSFHAFLLCCCRNSEAEAQGVNVELGAALEHLFHHKLHIQQTLEQVHKHVEDVHKDMLAIAC